MTYASRSLVPVLSVVAVSFADDPASAQPAPSPTTQVLAILTVKSDVPRADVLKSLPDEVRATVRLYLDGKIQQWYGRADGKGVLFILNCASVEEAKKVTEQLPFDKAGIATFEYMALTPLSPLRVLVDR